MENEVVNTFSVHVTIIASIVSIAVVDVYKRQA